MTSSDYSGLHSYRFFCHLLAFPALMSSVFTQRPHTLCAMDIENTHMKESHCEVFAGCGVGSVQRSLYIHLLSLLPWQGKEELCLQKAPLQPFPSAAFTSHRCHGDRPNERDCTVRQACRKGRRDVLFSPTMAFTLLCQRLSASASLIRLPGLTAAHVEACANTQSARCHRGGKYLPPVFVDCQE